MSEKREGSCILYGLVKRGVEGSITLDGARWFVTVVSTGREKPSHQLFLRHENRVDYTGAALFKSDPGFKSIISGSITIGKEYWVDIYLNKSNDDRGDFLSLSVRPKKPSQEQAKPSPAGELLNFGAPAKQAVPAQEPVLPPMTYDDELANCFDVGIPKQDLIIHLKAAGHEKWNSQACTPLVRQLIDVTVKARQSEERIAQERERAMDDDIPF